jgi:4-phytase/acid phosphatase/peptide/nickel transport system substrate-binding protein
MTLNVNRSRRVRQIAIGLGLALAVSTVGVSGSSAAKVQAAKSGGSITVGIFDTFPGWGPKDNPANSSLMAAKTMYETLFELNADGRYVPYLAASITPSADFKVWTLKLRDGITFHDGAKFDAAAVKANLDASNGTQILTIGLARSACTAGTNLGFYSNILKNTVIDPLTLQINLHLANSEMPETLYASGRAFMRSPAQLTDPTKCGTTPIGTGPFKMSAWSQTELTVVKNTTYWRKDAAGVQLPYLNSIKFVYAKESAQRANGVKSGTFDAVQMTSGSDTKQMLSLRKNSSFQKLNSGAFWYPSIWFNTTIAPFNVKECRLAVSAAIDRAQYVKVRQNGVGEIATSVVGKGSDLYNKAGFQGFDAAKAKTLVATCATALGKPLEFTYPSDTSSESQANATFLKNQLAKAGITMNIKVEETAVIIKNAFPQTYQAMGLLLNEAKGAGFVMPFWVSNNFGPASPNPLTQIPTLAPLGKILNLSKTNDPALDAALFAARGEGNAAKKAALYKSATKIVQENGYSTAISTTEYDMVVNKKLKGIDGLPLLSGGKAKSMANYGMNFTGVYIEK